MRFPGRSRRALARTQPWRIEAQLLRKIPPFGGIFLHSRRSVGISLHPCPAGSDSAPGGSDPAVAVRVFGHRPAAGRTSGQVSDFAAGPDSGSGWTSGSPLLNVARQRTWEPLVGCGGTFVPKVLLKSMRSAAGRKLPPAFSKTISVQDLRLTAGAVAAPGSHC